MDTTRELFDLYHNVCTETVTIDGQCRLYFSNEKTKTRFSPWHDIPYKNVDGTYNMVCEIPRYTRKKFEVHTKLDNNPICQDTIDGKLREYAYGDSLFNYGCMPRTWEDPNVLCDKTQKYGDNDPLDIVDIGDTKAKVGLVYKVKVLGVIALIDEGQTDWKVIGINTKDVNSRFIHTLRDVEAYKPGCMEAVKTWFEHYKTAVGKGKNSFGLNGEFKDMDYTNRVIESCHDMWVEKFSNE